MLKTINNEKIDHRNLVLNILAHHADEISQYMYQDLEALQSVYR